MSREWRLYLEDMITCCLKIEQYTEGFDLPAFLKTPVVYDAVLRNLEILGEAAKRILRVYTHDILCELYITN